MPLRLVDTFAYKGNAWFTTGACHSGHISSWCSKRKSIIEKMVSKVVYYNGMDSQIILYHDPSVLSAFSKCHAACWRFSVFTLNLDAPRYAPWWLFIGFPIETEVLLFRETIFSGAAEKNDELRQYMTFGYLEHSDHAIKWIGSPSHYDKQLCLSNFWSSNYSSNTRSKYPHYGRLQL